MSDLRFALRQLLKNPGFTAVAVLTLVVGIGACTAMYGVVHAVLWRPLPFHNPGQLVWIEQSGFDYLSDRTHRVDTLLGWRQQNTAFEGMAAYDAFYDYAPPYVLTGKDDSRRLRGVPVSQDFLGVLGVRPVIGRGFAPEECVDNAPPVAILSHALWRQHFAGDPEIVGQAITLNNRLTEIVGVLPPSFDFDSIFSPGANVDLLVPFPLTEAMARKGNTLFAIGRLKPDVTPEEARTELTAISERLKTVIPQLESFAGVDLTGLNDSVRRRFRSAFYILSAAVMCVLLIACFNLSNLLLARANARRQELAVRVAIGASRWHLIQQTLTESLLLAACGSALGIVLALTATRYLSGLTELAIPLLHTATVDGASLGFAIALSCFVGIMCGLLPVLEIQRHDTSAMLKDSGQRAGGGRGTARVRDSLVIAEVSLACMLLIGAGLLISSFGKLLDVDLGFEPARTIAWRADSTRSFESSTAKFQHYDALANRVQVIPGIQSVGLTDILPLGRDRMWSIRPQGNAGERPEALDAYVRIINNGYMQTLGIPLLAGRYFDSHDTAEGADAIIIGETLGRTLWPDRNPAEHVGRIVRTSGMECTVVGVVKDVIHGSLDESPQPEMYLSMRQVGDWSSVQLVVRTAREPESSISDVRAVLREFDPALPSADFSTLNAMIDRSVAPRRLITGILSSFSSIALLLAAIGLYGVISYSVGQRTREMGVRLALGAQRRDVLRLILSHGLKITIIGIAIGLLGAWFGSRLLESQLFGVAATDPSIFAANAVIVTGVALLACLQPARRAANTDPMEALRSE